MNIQLYLRHIIQHPVVWTIIIISLVPFGLLQINGLKSISGWFIPADLALVMQSFELWRVITPIFVHYTPLHLLVNLYLWWLLGTRLEARSPACLLLLLTMSAVISNLCQYYLAGPKFGGLSGVVYALFGYCWLSGKLRPDSGLAVDRPLAIGLVAALIIAATGLAGLYSNGAHIAGLLFGLISAYGYSLYSGAACHHQPK